MRNTIGSQFCMFVDIFPWFAVFLALLGFRSARGPIMSRYGLDNTLDPSDRFFYQIPMSAASPRISFLVARVLRTVRVGLSRSPTTTRRQSPQHGHCRGREQDGQAEYVISPGVAALAPLSRASATGGSD